MSPYAFYKLFMKLRRRLAEPASGRAAGARLDRRKTRGNLNSEISSEGMVAVEFCGNFHLIVHCSLPVLPASRVFVEEAHCRFQPAADRLRLQPTLPRTRILLGTRFPPLFGILGLTAWIC
jgi:hypothetical protein